MAEIIFIGARYQITWRPSFFPFGTLDEFLIPIGQSPLFHGDLKYVLPVHRNPLEGS
jgi:hypothetical protein